MHHEKVQEVNNKENRDTLYIKYLYYKKRSYFFLFDESMTAFT
jgi:hypothetical protein